MNTTFGTTTFVLDSGERSCLVIDKANGLPLYYPNLFLTTQVRNSRFNSFSSILSTANNLVVFLKFLSRQKIVLENRILSGVFFEINELDALRDFTQRKFSLKSREYYSSNIFSIDELEESEGIVDLNTQYMRLTNISNYFYWLANHLIYRPDATCSSQLERIREQIKSRRPSKRGRNLREDRSLDNFQIKELFSVISIGSDCNPFSLDVQRRNRLMILILYYTGIRGGELLNLKIEDINFSKNQIRVVRRADELKDPRINQPNVKTLERTIPLSEDLAKEIHDYILNDRRGVKKSKGTTFLFITHKSGPTLGDPVSKSSYYKIMSALKAVSPILFSLTGHMLRHTWNYNFSEIMDAQNLSVSEVKQEQMRSYLMGWKPGSGTAAHYNKRFVEKQAKDAALELQRTSGTRLPKDFNEDR